LTYSALVGRLRHELGQEHRYAHSIRVARCAELLAMRHGVSTQKARVAGLLHDVARLYSPQRLLAECTARGIDVDRAERDAPILLHAKLGAALAQERFGVDDPAILSAISKHTNGSREMSPLDCVVFLADSLEPGKHFPERAELWSLARRDLDAAMRATLSSTITYLKERGLRVAPQTLHALDHFTEKAS
jgi:predicted HD superfamily hydrolase involved in NAD metabolism